MNDNADEANDRVSPPPTDEAQDSGETTDRPAPPVTPQSAEAPSSAADAPEAAAGEDDILVPGSPSALGDPYGDEEFDLSREDFEKLLSEHEDMIGEFREGEIVNAKVLRVTENSVILDFGFKSEGSVALEEFKDPSKLQIGRGGRGPPREPRGRRWRRNPFKEERRTSSACGRRSRRLTRRIDQSRESSPGRSKGGSPWISWVWMHSSPDPRSLFAGSRTSRTYWDVRTTSRSSSSTSAAETSSSPTG